MRKSFQKGTKIPRKTPLESKKTWKIIKNDEKSRKSRVAPKETSRFHIAWIAHLACICSRNRPGASESRELPPVAAVSLAPGKARRETPASSSPRQGPRREIILSSIPRDSSQNPLKSFLKPPAGHIIAKRSLAFNYLVFFNRSLSSWSRFFQEFVLWGLQVWVSGFSLS